VACLDWATGFQAYSDDRACCKQGADALVTRRSNMQAAGQLLEA
jgi:hypothetical protein